MDQNAPQGASPAAAVEIVGPDDGFMGACGASLGIHICLPGGKNVFGIHGWFVFPSSARFHFAGRLDELQEIVRQAQTSFMFLAAVRKDERFSLS